ncbi:MAG: ABC transporter permease [Caldilineaceae bacterium]
MIAIVSQLIQAKELLWAWTSRIVRSRYQQSVLGGLWIIVQPVATAILFTVVFTFFVPVNTGEIPYVVFSYTALTPWLLFANGLNDMANSLVENMQLVTKIYFPREILPIAALLARLLDFLVAVGLLFILILYFRVPLFAIGWFYLPVILAIQLILLLGLGLALATLNVFYRDVKPLLTLIIQLWFYASPIIYPVSMVPEQFQSFYFLNPMAGILEAYRAVLLDGNPPGLHLMLSGSMALIIAAAGYWFFKRTEFQFADVV